MTDGSLKRNHADDGEPPVEGVDSGVRWPRWLALGGVVVTIAVAAAFGTRFGTDPTTVDSPLIGRPAPDVTLPYLERDGQLALADLRGQVVVVNFWASWCVPCREEHADLVAAAAAYEHRGVTFIGIVYQDRREQAIGFLDELGRGYDHLEDPGSRAAIAFGLFGIPETFFIDTDGVVAAKVLGKTDYPTLSATLDAVLVGEQPGSKTGGALWQGRDG